MKIPVTITVPLWLLLSIVFVLSVGGYLVSFLGSTQTVIIRPVLIASLILTASGWTYISLRMLRFFSRLRIFFRRLLANDYSTGMRNVAWLADELSVLTDLTNKTADQLRAYDELRAERTSLSFRAMDLLFRNDPQGIILADMEKKLFRFNPAAQNMYCVKQETYSFETIEKQKVNTRFFRIFLIAALKETVTTHGSAVLQLPQRQTALRITFKLEPLKDKSEKVRFAFMFIAPETGSQDCSKQENNTTPVLTQ